MNKLTVDILLIVITLSLNGCAGFQGERIRSEHTEEFLSLSMEKTAEILDGKVLGLDDCIQVALRNNLDLQSAVIQQRIAKLERKTSFANFLPTVSLNVNYTRWDPQPKVKFGSSDFAMFDERIREINWQIQMSVFDPSTWFMHYMYERGEEIAELVTEYTKQMIVLEVTANYYYCLSLEQAAVALESQLSAAEALQKGFDAFKDEGMLTQWQAEQAQLFVLAKQTDLNDTKYTLTQAKADLLTAMGLSPLAEIHLKYEAGPEAPTAPLEELVFESLINHPQLQIADRTIAIEEEKTKLALAAFLPRLTAFANRTNTSDSFQVYQNYWMTGLTGTISLFNGFANINQYKAAKEQKQKAFIQREQASLALMLQVTKAYLNLKKAQDIEQLAGNTLQVQQQRLTEYQHKYQEGLISGSEVLDVLSQRDTAQAELNMAQFQLQLSNATLLNAMGKTDTELKE